MWKWVIQNREWLFSGAGLTVLAAIWRVLAKRSYAKWTAKWEQAADALTKIYPGYVVVKPGTSTNAYELVFSGPLRQRIEHHLGKKVFFTNKFQSKVLSKDELLNPVVQEVITEVLDAVEKFKREHTDWSRWLKLLS